MGLRRQQWMQQRRRRARGTRPSQPGARRLLRPGPKQQRVRLQSIRRRLRAVHGRRHSRATAKRQPPLQVRITRRAPRPPSDKRLSEWRSSRRRQRERQKRPRCRPSHRLRARMPVGQCVGSTAKGHIDTGLANVTRWGPTVMEEFGDATAELDFVCLQEHRCEDSALAAANSDWQSLGFRTDACGPAERTGEATAAVAAGTAVLGRARLQFEAGTDENGGKLSGSRWSAVTIHMKQVQILLLSIYLHAGEGMSP